MEHKVQQAEAMKNAKKALLDVAADFEKTFGRKYGFFEEYRMEDAEVAIVLIGSTAGTAKACIDQLRAAGRKVGLIKLRVFRPFPGEELAAALSHVKAVAVMDKSEGFSACGRPGLCRDLRGVLRARGAPRSWSISFTVWAAATLRPATSRAYLTTCSCS